MKKLFSKQELKILVYRKMKSKKMTYEEAKKELEGELNYLDKKK